VFYYFSKKGFYLVLRGPLWLSRHISPRHYTIVDFIILVLFHVLLMHKNKS
jgi:hypothetical protein